MTDFFVTAYLEEFFDMSVINAQPGAEYSRES
jgi:hypothetical protein